MDFDNFDYDLRGRKALRPAASTASTAGIEEIKQQAAGTALAEDGKVHDEAIRYSQATSTVTADEAEQTEWHRVVGDKRDHRYRPALATAQRTCAVGTEGAGVLMWRAIAHRLLEALDDATNKQ